MSLDNLFSKLKGGYGSGNHGHAGVPGRHGGSAPGGGIGGGSSADLSVSLKTDIAKRIKGIADFSRSRKEITVNIQETVKSPTGGSSINVFGRFKGTVKDFRNFDISKLDNLQRNPDRINDNLSINWYESGGKSERRDITT